MTQQDGLLDIMVSTSKTSLLKSPWWYSTKCRLCDEHKKTGRSHVSVDKSWWLMVYLTGCLAAMLNNICASMKEAKACMGGS